MVERTQPDGLKALVSHLADEEIGRGFRVRIAVHRIKRHRLVQRRGCGAKAVAIDF
jgi:hypothetical protein